MRREREITIKVIENNKMKYQMLASFFAKKFSEKRAKAYKEKV